MGNCWWPNVFASEPQMFIQDTKTHVLWSFHHSLFKTLAFVVRPLIGSNYFTALYSTKPTLAALTVPPHNTRSRGLSYISLPYLMILFCGKFPNGVRAPPNLPIKRSLMYSNNNCHNSDQTFLDSLFVVLICTHAGGILQCVSNKYACSCDSRTLAIRELRAF